MSQRNQYESGTVENTFTTVEPPNKGHFRNNMSQAGLSIVTRWFKSYCTDLEKDVLGPRAVSFIER